MRMTLRVCRTVKGKARDFDIFHGGIDVMPRDGQKIQVFTGCGDAAGLELTFRAVSCIINASTASQHALCERGIIIEVEPMPGDPLAWTNRRIETILNKEDLC